jgi:predicted dehydrogenase
MIKAEAKLPLGERMDFIAIVTPNHMHFPPAKMALENGFHVLSDKPATFDLSQAKEARADRQEDRPALRPHAQLHGYPLVKEARDMVAAASSARSAKSSSNIRKAGSPRASKPPARSRRAGGTDPKRSGAAGCIGDIGTHAENLAEYITGLQISELAADITAFVKGRKLDDDGNVLLRFKAAPKAFFTASQISVGEENNINIRVYGEKGGLEWHQNGTEHDAAQMARSADAGLSHRQRLSRQERRCRHAHAARASRGLPRSLREYLQELRQRHSRPPRKAQAREGRSGQRLSEDRRRRSRMASSKLW